MRNLNAKGAIGRHDASPWGDAKSMANDLVGDGWVSPDTYSNSFSPVTNRPAVYLFLLHETNTYRRAMVAYVGMSRTLLQRLSDHNILPDLHATGYWPMRWFKPVRTDSLRTVERAYIEKYDPAWNIIGRRRGVQL